ncbi:hypothetical protein OP862_02155 [Yersinia massiliensis]|uniref:Phage protein n=1 Tax=Yersinia aldovae TaxID=29483 RepID=A0ABP1YXX9_YERAL|nr:MULTISPECIES: hypothetical protein [Yersinia]MBX9474165.1 hypothetical protein [Yersinia enterocolitica]MDA5548574.1 hypothetical protein [Yersinia massiliensis]UZM79513.1 hypothetical protein OP862_02155 [Yersinia massiliensis]CNL62227.1 Uncharacterised protein [Yersinia aldovae]
MFTFNLNQKVEAIVSGEMGHIKARAEYTKNENHYLLHMKAGDGRAVDRWLAEGEIKEVLIQEKHT